MIFGRKKRIRIQESNNRLNIILAIIFLLVGAIIFRLYSLQVIQYDLYVALASDQHQVYNMLEPSRGVIMIKDNKLFVNPKKYSYNDII